MLGYTFSEAYKQQLKDNEVQKQREAEKRKERRKQEQMAEEWDDFSDETFAFITGYTSGGAPFGVTWEEMENGQDFHTDSDFYAYDGPDDKETKSKCQI
ncbi:hypothetical protein WMZ97_13450 [Lentibacillus sp. N15]